MTSRNHMQKICAGLYALPLYQNHIILAFLLYLFGAVSQNYLRYCLLDYSPHFPLNKILSTTFRSCFFQVYTVLSISASGPRITPFPISTKINIITAFGLQRPSSKICVLFALEHPLLIRILDGKGVVRGGRWWKETEEVVISPAALGFLSCQFPWDIITCQLRGFYPGASLIAQLVKNPPAMQET